MILTLKHKQRVCDHLKHLKIELTPHKLAGLYIFLDLVYQRDIINKDSFDEIRYANKWLEFEFAE